MHLIKEQYYAVSYLYKSIRNVRHTKSIYGRDYDDLFTVIEITLQEHMICNYRSVRRVYGEHDLSIDEINGIQLHRIQKRELTSLTYRAYAIITLRLLSQWMESIENMINNLEHKLF